MKHRLGLVLSGGGARGLAHAGLIAALEERGIEAGCVSGTSSGAIVGALYAAGYSSEEMLTFFERKNPFKLSNLSFGKPGFIDTDKVRENLLEYFPDDSFEALGKELYVTATDIVRGEPVVFASGPLVAAVVASASVPMIFTPTFFAGRCLLDGGILDNFPVEPLFGRCAVLLGSYASPLESIEAGDLGSSLAVAERALDVAMFHASRPKLAACDVLISPPELHEHAAFDTHDLREVRDIGYRATQARLAELERALASV